MIETHAHLDFPQYDADRDAVIERAKDAGIKAIINIGATLDGCLASVELSRQHDFIYAACGIHPHDAGLVDDDAIKRIAQLIRSENKVVAVGEVGIDLYRNLSPKDIQQHAFERFVCLSNEFQLPLVMHCRERDQGDSEAADTLLDILRYNLDKPYKGVVHCFSGDEALLDRCLELGLYISYTCNITYKGADRLRRVLEKTPLDRLLLETDSPYLSPQPKRGKRNEPCNIRYLLKAIAETKGVPETEIEENTDKNARRLFSI
jgi:TatD DNase family protein